MAKHYVIKMIQRGEDEPDFEIEETFTGTVSEAAGKALDRAAELNATNEASWRHYFASQYTPDEIIWNG